MNLCYINYQIIDFYKLLYNFLNLILFSFKENIFLEILRFNDHLYY
jgi:hypothetical protein